VVDEGDEGVRVVAGHDQVGFAVAVEIERDDAFLGRSDAVGLGL